jgi:hypothetical protein
MKRMHHSVMLLGLFFTGIGLVNATGCLSLSTTTPDGVGGRGGNGGNGEITSSSASRTTIAMVPGRRAKWRHATAENVCRAIGRRVIRVMMAKNSAMEWARVSIV